VIQFLLVMGIPVVVVSVFSGLVLHEIGRHTRETKKRRRKRRRR
jgi:hypothetical protein